MAIIYLAHPPLYAMVRHGAGDEARLRKHGEDAYPDTWGDTLRRVEELNANPHEDEAWQGM